MKPSLSLKRVSRIKFHHGLGDVLMFRNILETLKCPIQLYLNPMLGQKAIFHGHPNVSVVDEPDNPEDYKEVLFHMENSLKCSGGKPTKVRICMEHEFNCIMPELKIRPLPLDNLNSINTQNIRKTKKFIKGFKRYAVCHIQGSSEPDIQNPDEKFTDHTVRDIISRGYGVVIINYDYVFHNPLNKELSFIDGDRIRSTYKKLPMEFESLWYLIKHADLFIGVDSGPLHTAACLDTPTIYLKNKTNFTENFYDCGIENIVVVDITRYQQIPSELLDNTLGNKPINKSLAMVNKAGSEDNVCSLLQIPQSENEQAIIIYDFYKKYADEIIKTGIMHDEGILGGRGIVYRTDAELLYMLIRCWKPDLVIDFCTGSGDALSYILHSLMYNEAGLCISADFFNRKVVTEWLHASGISQDRLILMDERDIRKLFPLVESLLAYKDRILWVLDTNHEYEMGIWQLENIIRPYQKKSIFAKDDIVAVNNVLESDRGAIYAIRDYICSNMDVISTNAAFGSVSGLPCSQKPYKGASGRTTPGAIPFQACRRNIKIQQEIREVYPKWDPDANKMIFFGEEEIFRGLFDNT